MNTPVTSLPHVDPEKGYKWLSNRHETDNWHRADVWRGRPQATAAYSVSELEAQGMVGIYAEIPVDKEGGS